MSNCKCNICVSQRMASVKVSPNSKVSIIGFENDGKFNRFIVLQKDLAYAREVLNLTDFSIKQTSTTSKRLTHQAKAMDSKRGINK